MTWAKVAGQAELRENLRAAMRQSGRSQRDVAAAAGVPLTHVTGGLAKDCWLRRDAVAALAAELELSVDELVGGSIFKDEKCRYAEFLHPHEVRDRERAEKRAAMVASEDSNRALCCVCGSLRKTGEWTGFEPDLTCDTQIRGRLLDTLWCHECDQETKHAVLTTGSDRDAAEVAQRVPSREELARSDLRAMVDRLRGFGVDVRFDARLSEKSRTAGRVLAYEYDRSKSQWRIELVPDLPAIVQLDGLRTAWAYIAAGATPEGCTPGKSIVISANSSAWDRAVEDLLADARRQMDVERCRMVEHHRRTADTHRLDVQERPSD